MNGPVCHVCPKGGTDDQIAKYLSQGGVEWTKEEVSNIRGLYDTIEDTPVIPEDQEGKELSPEELVRCGELIASYKHELAIRHLKDLKDSTKHPAKSFEKLYKVNGWTGSTRSDRINMIVHEFTKVLTKRQKQLAAKGIKVTREQICNGHTVDGKKADGQFSVFEEVFYKFYNDMKNAALRIDVQKNALDSGKINQDEYDEKTAKDRLLIEELTKVISNWGPLCSFARMRIKDREGIKLGNTFEYASATSADDFTTNEPLEEEYTLEESVREAWMTHEGEMSAFSNLGAEVRRFLSTVPVRVNGKTQTDDLGYPKFYDPITTHQYVAEKLRGYKKESDMLEVFRAQIAKGTLGDPILINVGYSLLEAAGVPKTPLYDRHGLLKKDAKGNPKTGRQIPKGGKFTKGHGLTNHSIITQFVTDLHANMVPFTAMIRNRNGDIVIKRLNRNVESIGLNEYLLQIKTGIPVTVEDRPGAKPVNSIFDDGGSMNADNYTRWHDEVVELLPPKKKKQEGQDNAESTSGTFIFANMEVYAADDSDAGYKALRNADKLDFLMRALRCIGVNLTDEEFRILHHNLPARWKVLRNLSSLATFMEQYKGNFVAQGSEGSMSMHTLVNQTVGQVDEFGRKAKPMIKSLENIFSAIDEVTGNKGVERRVSWYDRKGHACSRYSDQTPSYMGDLVDEIKTFVRNGDGKGLQDFLMKKWGSDDFFYDRNANGGKGKFRNTWLQELYDSVNKDGSISSTSFAATFEFTEFLGSDIDHKPSNFENFSEKTHAVAMLKNFVQLRDLLGERHKYADYPCFILGDAGKQRFFRAKHYSIDTILDKMVDIYDQELVRMKDAEALKRALALRGIEEKDMPEDYVKGTDKFSILTFLNPDTANVKEWREITGITEADLSDDNLTADGIKDAIARKPELLRNAIQSYMEHSLQSFMDRLVDHGVLEKNEHGKYVDSEGTFATSTRKLYDSNIAGFVEDFFWNTKFATIQQIQMFTVDTSFYQSVKDLQKRYKEIYAPGKGLSLEARDYEGNLYSEKSYETAVYFEDLTSFSDERPEFDETLKNGLKEDSPDYAEYNDRKKGSSITDGQGYRTLDSYRAIMGMQGKWTREMENAYQKIVRLREIAKTRDSKELTADEVQQIADLQMIFQPLKPYMFTLEKVDVGEDPTDTNEPKRHKYVMVPVQHKYAEVVLIPEVMPKGKLRDMALWMQENHVDLLASTKCVKVGAYGAAKIQGKEGADLIDALNADSTIKHQLNYSDYRIQSGVPEHLNQNQLFGTQIRKLIYSGIKKDKQYGRYLRNILRQYDGEGELEVYIPGAGMQKLTGDNVINLYNSIIMADMFDSYEQMEAHANTKQQLSDMLMQNGISNANQVEDVLMGYAIDDDGDFTFPIGDPTMEHDSTGLLLSILKKGVNKQKIHGGSAVQMAPMGTVEDGGLREVCSRDKKNVLYEEVEVTWNRTYIDIEGNKIPLKFSDYCFADNVGNHNIGDLLPYVDGKGNPYIIEEYITDKNGERKVNPEWEEYQSFTYKLIDGKWEPCDYREDGAKVIKPKIEVEFPGSLDMIAYRIPTERLYSTINCKVKRFSHPAAGGVLKVPVSGTTKAGFDFDIDKLYFFMKEFSQQNLSPKQVEDIWNDIYGDTPGLLDALKEVHNNSVKKQKVLAEARRKGGEDLADFVKRTEHIDDVQDRKYKYWSTAVIDDGEGNLVPLSEYYNCDSPTEFFRRYVEEHKKNYPTPFDAYDLNKAPSDQSKIARGNMLIGIIRERLKDEETFKERYTPGGFRKLSKAALDMRFLLYGDRSEIAENGKVNLSTIDELSQEVKDKKRNDPEPNYDYSDPSTILIYNQQNQIAAKLIGIFANQNTHHVFCSSLYALESNDVIAFGDHTERGLYDFLHKDNLDRAAEIDNNMAELLAAAVDAVKDPVLNYLNLNLTTADSAAVLIRLGYSQREIGLLFNQPIIKDLCEEIANTGVSVEVAINKVSKKYETDSVKWKGLKYDSSVTGTQQLADNILEGRRIKEEGIKEENIKDSFKENQLQVLKLFNQIQGVASEMNSFVQSTRFTAANSIGSTWGDIIAMLQRTEKFAKMYENQPIARKSKSSNNEEKDSKGPKLRILPRAPKPGETTMSVLDLSDASLNSSSKKFAEDNYGNPLGFEQCMLNLVRKAKNLFGVHYPHFTTLYTEIRNQLTNMTKHGTLDGNTINSIHRDLMDFLLIANSAYSDFDGDATIRQNPNILSAKLTDNQNIPNRIFYRKEFPEIIGRVITARDKLPIIHKSPFFSRLQQTRDGSAVYVKGVGGMQSLTSNDIVEAWMDAVESNETIDIDKWDDEGNSVLDQNGNPVKITYAVRDLAMGMFFHNFYRLGFNFHGTSTMHLTPIRLKQMLNVTGLASGNGSYVDFVRRVIRGEVSWDESGTAEANAINRKLVNLFVKQYILNHLDNYRFTFNVRKTSPVGKFLFEKSGLKDGRPANEFFLSQSEIEEKGYDNLLTVDGNVGDEYMMYKPALCLQVSDTVKYYYIADSGSSTEFNVASRSEGGIRYVRVNPLGVKGQLINYFDSETRLKKFQDS